MMCDIRCGNLLLTAYQTLCVGDEMATYYRSQASKAAGINLETLRFYEKNGLIPAPLRTDGGYRLYTDEVLARLAFIRRAKSCGFALNEIRHLLSLLDGDSPDWQSAAELLDKKVGDLDREITTLQEMKSFLEKVKHNLGSPVKCPILSSLLYK